MADVAGRVRMLERKLNWLMNTMRMKAAVPTGLINPDGKPAFRVFEGSLLELFHLAKEMQTIQENEHDLPGDVAPAVEAELTANDIN